MKQLGLTNEMIERNDEIDNETYDYILTLTEMSSDELEWDIELIASVVDLVKTYLFDTYGLKVRHPAASLGDNESSNYVDSESA